ncbi:MAG: GPW/gp25 family protein [Fibrobacter sp.]|nr:GPW/gp25 family protein [Fibrobacter sp.]
MNRAWKFSFSEIDSFKKDEFGFDITSSGGIAMVDGNASVRQSILMLLSVNPGERVMYPDYGCNLRRLVFSENDETTAGLAIHYIREAIHKWEKRVHLIRLDAEANKTHLSQLDITIEYRCIGSIETETLEYSIDLDQRGI